MTVIVSWAVASHWLIGVPFDLLFRARKCEPQEIADLEVIVESAYDKYRSEIALEKLVRLIFFSFILVLSMYNTLI